MAWSEIAIGLVSRSQALVFDQRSIVTTGVGHSLRFGGAREAVNEIDARSIGFESRSNLGPKVTRGPECAQD